MSIPAETTAGMTGLQGDVWIWLQTLLEFLKISHRLTDAEGK